MKTISFKIKTKHFRDCVDYVSVTECPLALALKDHLLLNSDFISMPRIIVGTWTVSIENSYYSINGFAGSEYFEPKIEKAKSGKDVKYSQITLIEQM